MEVYPTRMGFEGFGASKMGLSKNNWIIALKKKERTTAYADLSNNNRDITGVLSFPLPYYETLHASTPHHVLPWFNHLFFR